MHLHRQERLLVAAGFGWAVLGVLSLWLVQVTEVWTVYNDTGRDGGSGLFVDVAMASAIIWWLVPPLLVVTWRFAQTSRGRAAGGTVAVFVAVVAFWLSVYSLTASVN